MMARKSPKWILCCHYFAVSIACDLVTFQGDTSHLAVVCVTKRETWTWEQYLFLLSHLQMLYHRIQNFHGSHHFSCFTVAVVLSLCDFGAGNKTMPMGRFVSEVTAVISSVKVDTVVFGISLALKAMVNFILGSGMDFDFWIALLLRKSSEKFHQRKTQHKMQFCYTALAHCCKQLSYVMVEQLGERMQRNLNDAS